MLDVEVCLVEESGIWRCRVAVPAGSSVADAIAASGVAARAPEGFAGLAMAVFGTRVDGTRTLSDGDRIELLPPLRADPNLARQRRADRKRRERGDLRWLPGRG